MNKTRLEAFSDGVIAIIITIMVLELKVPHSIEFSALLDLYPVFLSYILSFIYIGIYWNNHHHMFHAVKHVSGSILLANLHLLFWLSLIPFTTAWMGENHFATLPTQLYGINLFLAGLAYNVLAITIIRHQGPNSILKKLVGKDVKGALSVVIYAIAFAATYYNVIISQVLYSIVALMWIVPDKRIEKNIDKFINH